MVFCVCIPWWFVCDAFHELRRLSLFTRQLVLVVLKYTWYLLCARSHFLDDVRRRMYVRDILPL